MKQKLLIFLTGLSFIIIFIFVFRPFNKYTGQSAPLQESGINDTIRAREYMDVGNALQYSDPDSASFYFNKSIDLLKPYAADKNINHMLASCYVRLASINNYNGNYPLSEMYDSLAMSLGLAWKNKDIMAQATNIKALLFFNQSEYPLALEYYGKAVSLAREAGNKRLETMINTNTAIIYYYQGNLVQAEEYFSKTMTIAREIGDSLLLSGSYINVGLVAQHAGNTKSAISNYNKAIEVCSSIGDDNGVLICYQNLGTIWLNNSNFSEALNAFEHSLQIANRMRDQSNMAKGRHNIGEVYASMGDYETAIDHYIQSAQIREQLNDLQGMAESYTSIGNLNDQRENYESALEYYQKSLEINQKLNYAQGIAKNYSNLSNIYRQTGQQDKGIELAFKSLELYQQLKYKEGMAELFSIIGSLYSGKRDYRKAEAYLRMALEKSEETDDKIGVATSLNELASLLLQRAEEMDNTGKTASYSQAIDYGNTALNLSRQQKVLPVQLEASLVLKEAWSKIGDFKKALDFSEASMVITDSLLNSDKTKALAMAEAKWNAESRQRKIDELEYEQELKNGIIKQKEKEGRLKNTIIYLLVTVTGLTLVMAFFIVFYIRKRRNMLYEKQLANMTMLRMQTIRNRMSPHFFFNVLSSVSSSAGNPEVFRKNMENLSLLLRKSIENIEQTAIPVQEELKVVKAFVDLQSQRIPGPFNVEFNMQEGIDLQRRIPAMMIQIPVENAIKHGLMPLHGEKKLGISVAETLKDLVITINDNGVGLTASAGRSAGTGTGLKVLLQTIALLNQRNKNKIEFNIHENIKADGQREGTRVRISVPVNFSFN